MQRTSAECFSTQKCVEDISLYACRKTLDTVQLWFPSKTTHSEEMFAPICSVRCCFVVHCGIIFAQKYHGVEQYNFFIEMKVQVLNWENQQVSEVHLDESVFGIATRTDVVHRVVLWQRAKARAGTHKVKQRNEVSGSTRKIYNQKGGGRARHGSIKAPIFVGGGIVFGPVVRSHEFKLNKKVKRIALRSALSTYFKGSNIMLMDDVSINERKTSLLLKMLCGIGLSNQKVLICDTTIDGNLRCSCANLHRVNVLPVVGMNVLDVIKHDKIILTAAAAEQLQQRLKD